MAQLVASMSGVVLGGVVKVVGSNLARGKIFTASIGSVDSLYTSLYIYFVVVFLLLFFFFVFLLYVPIQQLRSWRDGQFT